MEERKKSFLLYFDTYQSIAALSEVQRGKLLSLLFLYAMEVDDHPTDPEAFLQKVPDLPPETQMAFRFLASTIRRDTDKWRNKQRRYVEAARRRQEAGSKPGSVDGSGGGQTDSLGYYVKRLQKEREAAQGGKLPGEEV